MDYRFRDATIDDLPAIVDIYNSTVSSRQVTADLNPVPIESRFAWFDAHTPERRPLWVVEASEGGILGWLSLSDFYGRPAYEATVEVSIYLHGDARGKGLGRIFLKRALDAAPSLGVRTMLGFIFGHNEASRHLFHVHGFDDWGFLPRVASLDDVERDLVIVGRRI
jgi:phosphinothricin acetyltransferase